MIMILGNQDSGQAVENFAEELTTVQPDPVQIVELETGTDKLDESETCLEHLPTDGEDPELDPHLLSALGETIGDTPEYGDNIHVTLQKICHPLLKKGMPIDNKENILKEYLIPGNCRLLQAPKLNAEISAAVPDMVRNRDKSIAASQQQLGAGITALTKGIDVLLRSDNKAQAIKHLSNSCRLLCDSHNLVTKNRVKLVIPSLDKTFLHMINESERDETLFGTSLSEKIKAAKAIEKQGLQIKKPPVKTTKSVAPQPGARPMQGNWTAPPRYPTNRGGRGGYRKPQTTGSRRPYYNPASQSQRAQTQDKARASSQNHR